MKNKLLYRLFALAMGVLPLAGVVLFVWGFLNRSELGIIAGSLCLVGYVATVYVYTLRKGDDT